MQVAAFTIPNRCQNVMIHLFVKPVSAMLHVSDIINTRKHGSFVATTEDIQKNLTAGTLTSKEWAVSVRVSSNIRSTTYSFQWNLFCMMIILAVQGNNDRRPIKHMPFDINKHSNLLSPGASPSDKSLRAAMNYILLLEGAVKAQRPLTARSFRVFVRRLRRVEDYFQSVDMGLANAAIKSAQLYAKAMTEGKVKEGLLKSSSCCNKILLKTGIHEEARCCIICGAWFKFQKNK